MPGGPDQLSLYFASLFTHSGDGVLLTRLDGAILAANPAACRLLQRSEEEVCRLGRQGLVVPDPALDKMLETRRSTGVVQGLVHFRLPDGSELPTDCTSALLPGADGRTLTIFRDLTHHRAAAQALEASEALHRLLFTMAPAGVLLNDEVGVIHAFNDRAAAQLGYSREEFARLNIADIDVDDDRAALARRAAALHQAGSLEFETRHRHRSGEVREVLVKVRPVELRGRHLFLSVWEDLTERKQAEEAHRLEALGRLAGGVAHDFNNLLTVILSCADSLREAIATGAPPASDEVEEIASAGIRARDLVRQLLAFSRRQAVLAEPLDLNALVRSSAELLRRLLGEDVDLRLELAPTLGAVRCDRAQMERVLVNLGVNARDAMPGGGRITIDTAELELDEAGAARWPGLRAGSYVRLRVSDTGSGIPPEAQGRVFEPFFTTKPMGAGSGLGLSIVHGVVRQHGGGIRFDTAPGQGTTFELVLPRLAGPVAEAAPEPELPAGGTAAGTVLLVEDEPAVRAVTERALRGGGFEVVSAADGAEALARLVRLAEEGKAVDLLVTDAVMPGMDGLTLAEAVRSRCPDVQVVVTSGHPEDVLARRGMRPGRVNILLKPYAPGALLAHVRAALARR
ncbi:MAG: PAS domain S-box protein [Deltaproteobacteria bacterium]|nr:PAS domain S-box protein [Deltaproteobacteria bacterium]